MAVNMSASPAVPSEISDAVNARILAVSEDRIAGFVNKPFSMTRHCDFLASKVGASEIKPSKISPVEYAKWAERADLAAHEPTPRSAPRASSSESTEGLRLE